MTSPPDDPKPSTLQRLFLGRRPARGLISSLLPGGTSLFEIGDAAQALHLVKSGRLAIVRRDAAGRAQILGVVRPGEPVGEMALIGGAPHSAAAVALRDSEVLSLPRERVLREARLHPELMLELAGLMLRRARETASEAAASAGEPTVFGFMSCMMNAPARSFAERLATAVRALGRSVGVIGVEALEQPPSWFSRAELDHDLLFLSVESDQDDWRTVAGRQIDRLMIVARAGEAPPPLAGRIATLEARAARIIDVVLQHAPSVRRAGAQAWVDAVGADRILHMIDGSTDDIARLARVVTGGSIGLVLSGGGARAYAHVGAIQALREAGQPIDFVGGASMGGIIGAGIAMGWAVDELEARIREAFVKSNPVGDMAWPMVALSRGERVRARLQAHFGDVEFADLGLPFFCVSSNLTTGLPQIHRDGRVRDALRASCALPGVVPPVVCGADVLVDGGVLGNLPTAAMRALHRGPVFGVDVAESETLRPQDVERPPSIWRFIASGAWRRRGPPLVSLLIRSATVTTQREFEAARAASDALVTPHMPTVGLQDWKLFEPAVKAGYTATAAVLAGLDRPLTELRRAASTLPVASRDDLKRLEAEEDVAEPPAGAAPSPA